jgi:hypothetical protein
MWAVRCAKVAFGVGSWTVRTSEYVHSPYLPACVAHILPIGGVQGAHMQSTYYFVRNRSKGYNRPRMESSTYIVFRLVPCLHS